SLDLLNTMGLQCPYVTNGSGKAACDMSKSFILLANYDDKTLLRDWSASALANAIPIGNGYLNSPADSPSPSGTSVLMPWAPHSLFVELYLNGEYEGNYQLIEEVKVDSHRVNIDELSETDTAAAKVTGGYLMEIDIRALEAYDFITPRGLTIGLIDPDFSPDPEVPEQTAYISSYVDAAENALFSSNFTDPARGWRAWFDEAAAINCYIVNDVMGSVDVFIDSNYLYKNDNNPLIYMGPIWDYDVSSGNVNYAPIVNATVPWTVTQGFWYGQWFLDPGFKADVVTQWNTLKKNGVFTAWLASIAQMAGGLEQSQKNKLRTVADARCRSRSELLLHTHNREFLLSRDGRYRHRLARTDCPAPADDRRDQCLKSDSRGRSGIYVGDLRAVRKQLLRSVCPADEPPAIFYGARQPRVPDKLSRALPGRACRTTLRRSLTGPGALLLFRLGDAHFVSIDSNLLSGDAAPRMLGWLDADLAATKKYWKIAFVHHPPYPTGAHLGDPLCALVEQQVNPIVERHGVQLVLAGHEHGYERSFPLLGGQKADVSVPSTTYLITGGGGAFLENVGSLAQCVLSVSTHDYLRVDVAGTALTFSAIGLAGAVIDRITLNPPPAVAPGGIVNARTHSADIFTGSLVRIFRTEFCDPGYILQRCSVPSTGRGCR
ncbi:MAG TPA: CotH kinase family protein, partial [Bryobacteraceae bacterium]